jgi:hypothetical protein
VASQGAFCFRYFARKVPRIATAEPTDKTHYKVLGTYKSEAEASCGAASLAAEAMPEIQELVSQSALEETTAITSTILINTPRQACLAWLRAPLTRECGRTFCVGREDRRGEYAGGISRQHSGG